MNNEIKINDVLYVKKDTVKELGTGLYREIAFSGLIWQVIAEDAEKMTLLMKDVLPEKIIKEVFEGGEYDSDYDVKFNANESDWRWKNSIIRKKLNDKFLKKLNKDQMVPMTTTVWLDGESSTTVDYVRLLTLDEIIKLPKNIKGKGKYGHWSLSPNDFNGTYAYVFIVNAVGYLSSSNGSNSGAVAPVITLKKGSD